MFKHKTHRMLKNRAKKRRISSHNYPPETPTLEQNDYKKQRAHKVAINKLKRQPDLLDQVLLNLKNKRIENPDQPQLLTWQALIDSLKLDAKTNRIDTKHLEHLEQVVLDYDEQAKLLRQHSALDCLYEG